MSIKEDAKKNSVIALPFDTKSQKCDAGGVVVTILIRAR